MHSLLELINVTVEVGDGLGLATQTVLMLGLGVLQITFQGPDSSLQLSYVLLQYSKIAIMGLMCLDLLPIGGDYAVSGFLSRGHRCAEGRTLRA